MASILCPLSLEYPCEASSMRVTKDRGARTLKFKALIWTSQEPGPIRKNFISPSFMYCTRVQQDRAQGKKDGTCKLLFKPLLFGHGECAWSKGGVERYQADCDCLELDLAARG
jgi:hypothetical protein